jgi:hypothetical protein
MVSPDSQATACLPSGRNSTYRPVQISGTGSGRTHDVTLSYQKLTLTLSLCRHAAEYWTLVLSPICQSRAMSIRVARASSRDKVRRDLRDTHVLFRASWNWPGLSLGHEDNPTAGQSFTIGSNIPGRARAAFCRVAHASRNSLANLRICIDAGTSEPGHRCK